MSTEAFQFGPCIHTYAVFARPDSKQVQELESLGWRTAGTYEKVTKDFSVQVTVLVRVTVTVKDGDCAFPLLTTVSPPTRRRDKK